MKSFLAVAAAVVLGVLPASLGIYGCGGERPQIEAESSQSALTVTTGSHRASGSYTCHLTPFSTITYVVSTVLYLASTAAPNRWGIYLSPDPNAVAGGVTLDIRDSFLLEAADNGALVYSVPQDTIYVHRIVAGQPLEYTLDESAPPYSIQVLPASAGHPLGQLVIAMYPQGRTDPLKGECADPVGMYLQIQ